MSRVLIAVALTLLVVPAAASARVRKGPAGSAFYAVTKNVPAKHGTVIWARNAPASQRLPGAASTRLVLYSSRNVEGDPAAVSGVVWTPRGKAPKRGWPVVSWTQGTTGIADACAPSRNSATGPAADVINYYKPQLTRFLRAGYAVVRTDYEGLGTPGIHPFLNGRSEARSALDALRAARRLDKRIGRRFVAVGHSQGGQAALFTGATASTWTPELQLRGVLALAPISHLGEQAGLIRALKDPSSLSSFVGLILRGLDVADPALGIPKLLSERGAALYPQTLERCLSGLRKPDSFSSIAPADIVRQDADLAPMQAALEQRADAENAPMPTRVQIEQGTADGTVLKTFTDQLVPALRKRGATVTYKTYEGVDHGGVVDAAKTDSVAFVRSRLGR